MPRNEREPGFALLMVLVVLAVAGSLLGLCAHRSSRRALDAGLEVRGLQRKWAVWSIEATCLARAEAILVEGTPEGGPPPAIVRQSIDLGGQTFDLVVADEQAKANVNQVAAARGPDGVRACAGAVGEGRWVLQVLPRPVETKTAEIRSPRVLYVSLEQVFSDASAADLLGAGPDRPGPADRLTCWGNGRVHFRRAPAAVLGQALDGLLTQYDLHRLLTLRDELPGAGLSEILARLGLKDTVQAEAEKRLTQSSTCHSLWIVARGRTRDWYRLTVRQEGDAENDAGRWTFVW